MTTSKPRFLAGLIALFWALLLITQSVPAADKAPAKRTYTENPRVLIETTQGNIELELLPKFAPKHVDNFLNLVEQEFYPGLVFHRVIPGFMIQAGGYDADINYREHEDITVPNESFNGLKNRRGSVAAARRDDPDSADTQFFINVANNDFLDAKPNQPGYTVFGRVTNGFDTIERIELTDTHLRKGMAGVPEEAIVILGISVRP